MARSIAEEMKRSLGLDARDGADSFEALMGSRESREELVAMRVAELLRPAMGQREASGLEKLASGDHPLVEINVNTNNKGMETDKMKKAKRSKSKEEEDDDDDNDARLERRRDGEDHREARKRHEHREARRDSRKVKRYERLLDELDARVAHAGEAEAHVESRESRAREEKEHRLDDLLRAASEAAEKAEKKADELREAKDAVEHVSTDPDFDSDASHDPLDEMMARRERRQDEDAREAENPFMKRLADGVARWNAEHGIETSQPAWAAGRAAQAAEERHEEHRKLRPQSSTETSETLRRLDDELRSFDVDVPDAKAEYDATLGQLDIDDDDEGFAARDLDEGSAWDLDEAPEVDGIDGVIETAEEMGKVWAARRTMDADAKAAEVAKKTKTRDVEPGLKLNRGREAYETSAERGHGADVGSGEKPRGEIGSLLDELGVSK